TIWSRFSLQWLFENILCALLGAVPKPENVRMNSVNLKNILEWELAPLPYENVTFTAQSMSYTGVFEDVCKNIVLRQCDFSHLAKYGDHTLRIWMETEGGHSDWVNVTFHPVEDTVIGPPNLQVKPVSSSLHVHFSFPKIENEPETWTLKDYYGSWEYKVLYWKRGTSQKLEMVTPFESDMLPDLDPRTTYCLQAQGLVPALNKSGLWSQPICETTADDGKTPVWVIAVMLLASLVAVLLVVLCSFSVLWYLYRQARYVFFPGYSLPKLLKEVGRALLCSDNGKCRLGSALELRGNRSSSPLVSKFLVGRKHVYPLLCCSLPSAQHSALHTLSAR
uniref:Interleukin-10 receptor subunit beta n=1 Tax=Ornithorhynchus anatinus TaxID=9258 RepID=A0A6I8P6H6_ORNAN